MKDLEQECRFLTRYLLGQAPNEREVRLYQQAVAQTSNFWTKEDQILWDRTLGRPWMFGMIDSALALVGPNSGFRNRTLLMVAILEASPSFCDFFFPKPMGMRFFLLAPFEAVKTGLSALAGLVLLKMLKRQ